MRFFDTGRERGAYRLALTFGGHYENFPSQTEKEG